MTLAVFVRLFDSEVGLHPRMNDPMNMSCLYIQVQEWVEHAAEFNDPPYSPRLDAQASKEAWLKSLGQTNTL